MEPLPTTEEEKNITKIPNYEDNSRTCLLQTGLKTL